MSPYIELAALPTMQPLSIYFDPMLMASFARALPRLHRQLATLPFAKRKATFGIAGETFRAYTGWHNPPSILYREWAASICETLTPEALMARLETRQSFLAWHASLAASLQKHWYRHEYRHLSFAHQYKLVDLCIKWLSRHDFGSTEITSGFVAHANCALDRQTLAKLNACLSFALPMPAPSMGHILGPTTYQFTQEAIAAFALHCGGTPLLFDYFAWKKGG